MLDTTTKKRIDDCRDILVGKLPDPKAQIEQITIGLIYKFMDDMDKESIDLGGEARYFADYTMPDPEFPNDRSKDKLVEFSKYAWDKLNGPKVTAAEMLKMYSEAIELMEKNPNIPQLFRDIFNNAYLPYRDPETLKLFLKTIGEFEYTHSEKLGDAFEYLLSVMGSQGDAGQFRTPRHIIDFVVSIIDPDKDETIMDPACGTAGFLISAYKHILLKYTSANKDGLSIYEYNKLDPKPFNDLGDQLTPDAKKKLIENFIGYDISPDMVRLSLVNLYLHGFPDPHIYEYDTLSDEARWNETADVILANPPFMSPKGGIRPHKRFSIQSNRSEVLFVDYIAEHLNQKGRAGIIVPEGVIFQSGKAYKDLRKMLVDNYLYAVVSLPAGVFNPYSGVKTSVLLFNKEIAKQSVEILFVKIDNDGYNLGAQRTAVKGGQLEEALKELSNYPSLVLSCEDFISTSQISHLVTKSDIAQNGDYNLSGERYRTRQDLSATQYEIVQLGDLFEITSSKRVFKNEWQESGIPFFRAREIVTLKKNGFVDNELFISEQMYLDYKSKYGVPQEGDLLVTGVGTLGICYRVKANERFYFKDGNIIWLKQKGQRVDTKYVSILFDSDFIKNQIKATAEGGTVGTYTITNANHTKIPLPPLAVQEEIVAEIEGYQKIIDGAKAVVANYKPKIDIDPEWEMVELGEVGKVCMCKRIFKEQTSVEGDVPFYKIGTFGKEPDAFISNELFQEFRDKFSYPKKGDVLISTSGTIGRTVVFDGEPAYFQDSNIVWIANDETRVLNSFLNAYYQQINWRPATGVTIARLYNKIIEETRVPIPPLETQRQIVAQIEKEQELVNANKQLVEIFEQKIKDRISKVWGGSAEPSKSTSVSYLQGESELAMVAEEGPAYNKK